MGLSRIEEYHLKPGEEVYFLGKVEDNSKPVEAALADEGEELDREQT